MFYQFHPKPARAVGYRIFTNFVFWALVLWWLSALSGRIQHFFGLAGPDAKPLTVEKLLEIADGELWALQVLAGLLFLPILWLAGKWSPDEYLFFKHMAEDDVSAIALNFGTLFVLASIYRAYHPMPGALWSLALGLINIGVYVLCAPFDADAFEALRPSERPRPRDRLSENAYLASLKSPKEWLESASRRYR